MQSVKNITVGTKFGPKRPTNVTLVIRLNNKHEDAFIKMLVKVLMNMNIAFVNKILLHQLVKLKGQARLNTELLRVQQQIL